MKVVLIGLDGATWRVLRPLLERNKIPNIARLVREGASGKLDNLGTGFSPLIWTSIATGQLPKAHGIRDFTTLYFNVGKLNRRLSFLDSLPSKIKGGLGRYGLGLFKRTSVRSDMRRSKAVWEFANDFGHSAGVINWWGTYPAEPIDGFMVTDHANAVRLKGRADTGSFGWSVERFLRKSDLLHPEADQDILSGLEVLHDDGLIDEARRFALLSDSEWQHFQKLDTLEKNDPISVLKFSVLQDHFSIAVTEALWQKHGQPDLFLGLWSGLDSISHHFWRYRFPEDFTNVLEEELARFHNTLNSYYIWMDEIVGQIVDMASEDTVFVVLSDHGFHSASPDTKGPISGTHYPNPRPGILVCQGPEIASGTDLIGRSIDIAPTMLHAMRLPVSKAFAGQVLENLFTVQSKEANPVRYEAIPIRRERALTTTNLDSTDEEEAILERLRGLGYIDD